MASTPSIPPQGPQRERSRAGFQRRRPVAVIALFGKIGGDHAVRLAASLCAAGGEHCRLLPQLPHHSTLPFLISWMHFASLFSGLDEKERAQGKGDQVCLCLCQLFCCVITTTRTVLRTNKFTCFFNKYVYIWIA